MPPSDKEYLQINQALFSLACAYESRMAEEGECTTLGLALSDCLVLMVLHQFTTIDSRQLSHIMDINAARWTANSAR